MASLVADYGDSSHSDTDSEALEDAEKSVSAETELQDESKQPRVEPKPINYLTGEAGDNSSEDSDDESTKKNPVEPKSKLPNPLAVTSETLEKLPSPSLDVGGTGSVGSVFVNPFQKAEEAKHSILERHVKMTSSHPEEKGQGGKKICWTFRKGKCRFGHKCKYSHDNDVGVINRSASDQESHQGAQTSSQYGVGHWSEQVTEPELKDDDDYMSSAKRKRRPGIKEGLVPPKRAAQALMKERQKERPWTMQD